MNILTYIENVNTHIFMQNFLKKYYYDSNIYICENEVNFKEHVNSNDMYIFFIEGEDIFTFLDSVQKNINSRYIYTIILANNFSIEALEQYISNGMGSYIELPLDEMNLNIQIISADRILKHRRNLHNLKKNYSALKDLQNQFIQSEKLAGIGILASDIANEIYDPLSFLTSNIEILYEYSKKYDNIMDLLISCGSFSSQQCVDICKSIAKLWTDEKIFMTMLSMSILFRDTKDGLNRISTIVSELKKFSSINQLNKKDMSDLNENIKSTLTVAKNELKHVCKVKFNPSKIPSIFINTGEINQVILTIIINAADAIKKRNINVKGNIVIDTYVENNYVCCSIKDDGCGMTDQKVKNIFNHPFSVSLPVSRRNGLGLILAYDIVHSKHRGTIDVKSNLGIGSEFIIKLPITSRESEQKYYDD